MPALANNGIRVGRERINTGTSGKGEHPHFDGPPIAGMENDFVPIVRGIVEDIGPMFTVADILPGLRFIARHHANVASSLDRGLAHAVVTVGVTQADLAALLANPQVR